SRFVIVAATAPRRHRTGSSASRIEGASGRRGEGASRKELYLKRSPRCRLSLLHHPIRAIASSRHRLIASSLLPPFSPSRLRPPTASPIRAHHLRLTRFSSLYENPLIDHFEEE